MTEQETNKRIHELLGKSLWHEFKGNICIHCNSEPTSVGCKIPNYLSPDLPHSTVVEIVTKAVEKYGALTLQQKLMPKIGRASYEVEMLRLSAPIIVQAIAEMEDDNDTTI